MNWGTEGISYHGSGEIWVKERPQGLFWFYNYVIHEHFDFCAYPPHCGKTYVVH